jgi:hypothetical protein
MHKYTEITENWIARIVSKRFKINFNISVHKRYQKRLERKISLLSVFDKLVVSFSSKMRYISII